MLPRPRNEEDDRIVIGPHTPAQRTRSQTPSCRAQKAELAIAITVGETARACERFKARAATKRARIDI